MQFIIEVKLLMMKWNWII